MSEGLVGVRRRRSVGEAMSLVAEYEASGMSRREFCSARGLSVATLDLYRKRAAHGSVRPRLVAVELEGGSKAVGEPSPRSPVLAVVLRNGRRIEIGPAFDAGLLSELLAVLEQV
jgi:hypothetical protein